jgi:hypothetical protein
MESDHRPLSYQDSVLPLNYTLNSKNYNKNKNIKQNSPLEGCSDFCRSGVEEFIHLPPRGTPQEENKQANKKPPGGGFLFLKYKYNLVFSSSVSSPITSSVIASTSWWTSFHWASFIDSKFSSFEFLIVKHRDSFCSLIL